MSHPTKDKDIKLRKLSGSYDVKDFTELEIGKDKNGVDYYFIKFKKGTEDEVLSIDEFYASVIIKANPNIKVIITL